MPEQFAPNVIFWIIWYSAGISVVALWVFIRFQALHQRRKELTWDVHTEYIDIAEFSNRNIPLKITYKGIEPRWLWASYLTLRNSGSEPITHEDTPEKQGFVVGAPGCRYIGFNKLISTKAKVSMQPLFRENDVYCRLEFDRLGPGDDVLVSLLFIADEKQRIELEGGLFGAHSKVLSGYYRRMANWRAIWWLVLGVIAVGGLAGWGVYIYAPSQQEQLLYQLLVLAFIYFLALATAAVLLRPIYNWQQMLDRFGDVGLRRTKSLQQLRFLFFLDKEP